MSSGDMMSDVYEDRSRSRVPDIARSTNRETSQQRIDEEDEKDTATASGRSTSREGTQGKGGLLKRASTESDPHQSRTSTHRNRFFGRGNRNGKDNAEDGDDEDLMEQGRMDVRSGTVTPVAVRDTSASRSADPTPWYNGAVPLRSHTDTDDFEMRRIGGRR